ncbi:MAG: hypothetical protein JW769_04940 [Parachlamydiales bacterium]|nr:hypothetical protein [Parachlamydiales bacterium]
MPDIPPIDPFAHVRIEPPEEKKEEEQKKASLPPGKQKKWFAAALYYFQKKLQEFSHTTVPKAVLQQDFDLLLRSFISLSQQDLSHDTDFLKEMSHHWLKLLRHFQSLSHQKNPLVDSFAKFIEETKNYPPQEKYSFGYYLSEYAGLKWTPFPYMDILKKLHRDFQMEGKNSQLAQWIDKLTYLKDNC